MTPPSSHPTPFSIDIADSALKLLNTKLELATLPDELEEADWDYGVPLAEVRRLAAYWKDSYDWRAHQAQLNASLPQFTVDIPVDGFDTLNVHFVHRRSDVPNAIPLLFVHGWPGSFIEVAKILPMLNNNEGSGAPSFHVVAVSLPGHGFSEGCKKKGFGVAQHAEVAHKLMLLLGYEHYVTQGGDWGFFVTRKIGSMYGKKHCMACHTNWAIGVAPRLLPNPLSWLRHKSSAYAPTELAGLARSAWFWTQGNGYMVQQSTRPQTLAYALADSPVGLLAWILDRLVPWTDGYAWTDDEILTWVSIYWFSRSGPGASLRLYYEGAKANMLPDAIFNFPSDLPIGYSMFPKDILVHPKLWLKSMRGKVIFSRFHESGGHFASVEKPEQLVKDIREMFGVGGGAYNVVPNKSGYADESLSHKQQ